MAMIKSRFLESGANLAFEAALSLRRWWWFRKPLRMVYRVVRLPLYEPTNEELAPFNNDALPFYRTLERELLMQCLSRLEPLNSKSPIYKYGVNVRIYPRSDVPAIIAVHRTRHTSRLPLVEANPASE